MSADLRAATIEKLSKLILRCENIVKLVDFRLYSDAREAEKTSLALSKAVGADLEDAIALAWGEYAFRVQEVLRNQSPVPFEPTVHQDHAHVFAGFANRARVEIVERVEPFYTDGDPKGWHRWAWQVAHAALPFLKDWKRDLERIVAALP